MFMSISQLAKQPSAVSCDWAVVPFGCERNHGTINSEYDIGAGSGGIEGTGV
jgi:membrane-associated PAP2 superfamily phosphatase